MFTGIVEETGTVEQIKRGGNSIELVIQVRKCAPGLKVGDSLAVNGCCLTVCKLLPRGKGKLAHFDLLTETWNRTNLQFSSPGRSVNLERSLPANGRLGGHFVTGHIDGLGKIHRLELVGNDHVLEITLPKTLMRYVIQKGSIAVDGISLTVAEVEKTRFRIWIIPHTYRITAFSERKAGDMVNIEVDLLGKYVERFVSCSSVAD